ncbi:MULTISPECIES: hypothetical protein, partial [Blautia]|uniref:hypothetical protein n=1 Tax=Blautia TaxID=572511 RepID=UPI001A9BD32D
FICFPKLRFSDQRKTPQWQTGLCPNNKKRQISVRENWRAKNSHYYTESHGTIMPMQCYTCPEEEQCFFN